MRPHHLLKTFQSKKWTFLFSLLRALASVHTNEKCHSLVVECLRSMHEALGPTPHHDNFSLVHISLLFSVPFSHRHWKGLERGGVSRLPSPVWLRCHRNWSRLGEVFLPRCCDSRPFLLTGETVLFSEALSLASLYSERAGIKSVPKSITAAIWRQTWGWGLVRWLSWWGYLSPTILTILDILS